MTPLRLLRAQLESNLEALDHDLAAKLRAITPKFEYVIDTNDSRIQLAKIVDGKPIALPNPVTPLSAAQIAAKLFPAGKCTESILVAGIDQGWLWKALFELPCQVPAFPGYTPPLYFLTSDLERLWSVLHLHDWRALLSNSRVRLFAGADCFERAQQSLADNLHIPFPQLSVTIEQSTWPAGATLDTMRAHALRAATTHLTQLNQQLECVYGNCDVASLAERFAGNKKLRIMGITSRYTTFIQYSMRDWLDAFSALGHETKLLIEPEDCALFNAITFSEACAEFQPDLLLMIDRYRGEFSGMPKQIPWVMWIQDQLPHIFNDNAGRAQGDLDFAIGYGRIDCVYDHGYPADRFMPTTIPTNESRFLPRRILPDEYERFACDVSFISHASVPAEKLLEEEIARQSSPAARPVLEAIFEKLRARYDNGQSVTLHHEFDAMIESTMRDLKVATDDRSQLLNIFTHKINNALFRHQSLAWLDEMDLRVHLYGRGWEQNPRFAKYARGIADNQSDLSAIYQASRINLQVSPFGAAHQRVFDGLASGGFFLLRFCDGDVAEPIYRDLHHWCRAHDVRSDAQLQVAMQSSQQVRDWIEVLTRVNGRGPFGNKYDFVVETEITAANGFNRNAATLWDEYDRVVFRSRDELHALVKHFLDHDDERARIARSMRDRVLECMTYKSVARNTLDFVGENLQKQKRDRGILLAA